MMWSSGLSLKGHPTGAACMYKMEKEKEVQLGDFVLRKVIGKGSYGEVWLSKHRKDKKQYVLKKISLNNASVKERKAAEQECKLLSQLKHPNIVAYKDSFEHQGHIYIAMGYCEGGDLYNRLKTQNGTLLDERQVVEWFVQICMSLQYMHERNILHRDLKTQNIFLTRSKLIKVGDLGIARVLGSSNDMATTLIGTPYYMSPELFANKPYNHKSDVWALGCCVYEMATLKHAFNARDFNSLAYKILKGKVPDMPKQYSPELLELIRQMLNQNPDKRPSANRILRDIFIRKHIQIFLEGTKSRPRSRSGSRVSTPSTPSTPGTPANNGINHRPVLRPKPSDESPAVAKPSSKSSSSGSGESPCDSAPRSSANSAARQRRRQRLQEGADPKPGRKQAGDGNYSPGQRPVLQPRRRHGEYHPSAPEQVRQIVLVQKERHRRNVSDPVVSNLPDLHRPKNLQRPKSVPEADPEPKEEEPEEDWEPPPTPQPEQERKKSLTDDGEMSDFINCMNATLNMKPSDRQRGDGAASGDSGDGPSVSSGQSPDRERLEGGQGHRRTPSRDMNEEGPTEKREETIGRSNKMMQRMVNLRKDCLKTLGLEKLKQAYEILDNIEREDADQQLRALLGENLYRDYSSKIWQLKFCEESLFGPGRDEVADD